MTPIPHSWHISCATNGWKKGSGEPVGQETRSPGSDCNQGSGTGSGSSFPVGEQGCGSPPFSSPPFSFPQEYTMLCLLCGRAEDSVSILPDDPRQMTPLF